MTDEPNETVEPLPELDGEDLWVRGEVYIRHKRLLEEAEEQISELERSVARARYEQEITQRIRDRMMDPEARQDWDIKASVAHDFMLMIEHELEEASEDVAYHHIMVTEMEADLGDKAKTYEVLLADLIWEEEWDEEEFDELDDLDELALGIGTEACPFIDMCPIAMGEIGEEIEEEEDRGNEDEEHVANDK